MATITFFTLEGCIPYQKGKQNSCSKTMIGTPFFTFMTSFWNLWLNPFLQYETDWDTQKQSIKTELKQYTTKTHVIWSGLRKKIQGLLDKNQPRLFQNKRQIKWKKEFAIFHKANTSSVGLCYRTSFRAGCWQRRVLPPLQTGLLKSTGLSLYLFI
jgi:hypothetical protein